MAISRDLASVNMSRSVYRIPHASAQAQSPKHDRSPYLAEVQNVVDRYALPLPYSVVPSALAITSTDLGFIMYGRPVRAAARIPCIIFPQLVYHPTPYTCLIYSSCAGSTQGPGWCPCNLGGTLRAKVASAAIATALKDPSSPQTGSDRRTHSVASPPSVSSSPRVSTRRGGTYSRYTARDFGYTRTSL
ncbi:hypothetical protein PYCCODRAFT_1215139 [Trametes coccinea BRFM310]|uniref:Uncharacterized protein n=1 Tax=Trametes coccinea (strain BRFM310) TaxID=1353009 RepID=A0A1Y2I887_TRAC3|nr:hypothetical protein PYCCODRAFT_1215139 [Trametes coccinea BRFM310]